MALKAFVEDLEQVDEKYRDEYKKTDGGYLLSVEETDGYALENVEGLKETLHKVNKDNRRLKKLEKQLGDLDPDEARKAMERLEELEANPPEDVEAKAKQMLEREREKLIKPLQTEKEQLEERSKTLFDRLRNREIEIEAMRALDEHRGRPRLLMPHIQNSVRLEEEDGQFRIRVVDEQGEPRTIVDKKKGEVKDMTISDLVAEMAESDDYAGAFEGTGQSGGGTPPGGTRRPGGGRPQRLSRDASPRELGENLEAISKGEAQFDEA